MNTYEEKQEARKARFEELAMNARREADALARQSSSTWVRQANRNGFWSADQIKKQLAPFVESKV
jgi:hypothetical protein